MMVDDGELSCFQLNWLWQDCDCSGYWGNVTLLFVAVARESSRLFLFLRELGVWRKAIMEAWIFMKGLHPMRSSPRSREGGRLCGGVCYPTAIPASFMKGSMV
jgi:hypothetical protein